MDNQAIGKDEVKVSSADGSDVEGRVVERKECEMVWQLIVIVTEKGGALERWEG